MCFHGRSDWNGPTDGGVLCNRMQLWEAVLSCPKYCRRLPIVNVKRDTPEFALNPDASQIGWKSEWSAIAHYPSSRSSRTRVRCHDIELRARIKTNFLNPPLNYQSDKERQMLGFLVAECFQSADAYSIAVPSRESTTSSTIVCEEGFANWMHRGFRNPQLMFRVELYADILSVIVLIGGVHALLWRRSVS
jgi:hypothetical protein